MSEKFESRSVQRRKAIQSASVEQCFHGEIETDVARATIRCRKCGAFATLDAARSTPVPASNVSEGLREAAQNVVDALPETLRTASDGGPIIDTLTSRSPQIIALRSALAHAPTEGLDDIERAIIDTLAVLNAQVATVEGIPISASGLANAVRLRLSQPDATEEAGLADHTRDECRGGPWHGRHPQPDATEEAG